MTVLRDLVTRLSFQADTSPVQRADRQIVSVKNSILALGAAATTGWAAKTGVEFERLKSQMEALYGDGVEPVRRAIEGMHSAFSEEDATRAAVRLRQAGLNGKEAAELLQQAQFMTVRSGGNLTETVNELAGAIETGGLTDLLRKWGIEEREAAEVLAYVEQTVGQAGGDVNFVAAQLTRGFREALASGVFRKGREEYKAEFDKMMEGPAGAGMGVMSSVTDIWNRLSVKIMEGLDKPLRAIEKMLDYAADMIEEWEGFAKVWDALGEASKWVADQFEKVGVSMDDVGEAIKRLAGSELVQATTIGGLLMFLLTKDPRWVLGAMGGGVLLELFQNEWDSMKDFLSRPWPFAGATIGGFIGFMLGGVPGAMAGAGAGSIGQRLVEETLGQQMGDSPAGGQHPASGWAEEGAESTWNFIRDAWRSRPGGPEGEGWLHDRITEGEGRPTSSINIENININSNVSDPRLVGEAAVDAMKREFRAAGAEIVWRLEG